MTRHEAHQLPAAEARQLHLVQVPMCAMACLQTCQEGPSRAQTASAGLALRMLTAFQQSVHEQQALRGVQVCIRAISSTCGLLR